MPDSKDEKDADKSKTKNGRSETGISKDSESRRGAKDSDSNSLKTKPKESAPSYESLKYTGSTCKSIGFPANRSPSLESTSIRIHSSLGLPRQSPFDTTVTLVPEGGFPPELVGEIAYDCCVFMILCPKHGKIAISNGEKSKFCWFPFIAVKHGETWMNTAIAGASFILSNGDLKNMEKIEGGLPFLTPQAIQVLRIQVPRATKFITRVTFKVHINVNVKFSCCKNSKRIEWLLVEDVVKGNIEKLWGPEPFLLTKNASVHKVNKKIIDEYCVDDALQFSPHEPPRNKEEELLLSAAVSESDILALYTEFLSHCFPSQFMCTTSFTNFMIKFGWTPNDNRLFSFFKAFNFRGGGYLTFHELLLGLVAMDMVTKHGGHSGELRCGYVFRYYDSNNDGLLDYLDIQRMTSDIFIGKNTEPDEKAIEKDALYRMQQVLKLNKNDKVQFNQFITAISNLKFRGTSVLFRSPVSILKNISTRSGVSIQEVSENMHPAIAKRYYSGTCLACKSKTYKICTFSVVVDYTGRLVEPKLMIQSEGTDINWTCSDPITEQLRTFSRETVFNTTSPANNILNILRQYDAIQKKRIKAEFPNVEEWDKQDKDRLFTAVQTICKKAEEIFANEPRCLKLTSPVYVLGDTHGNIADVLVYERNLWRMGPVAVPSNFLFLGDYVDRGEFGIEVTCYLFAMKILAPDKFYLCRGNHEIRSIQKCFTFVKECNTKYGNRIGPQVCEACNKAFDRMPICAIIDDNIFGAHGGIPTSLMKIDDLMKIPTPLQEPETESPASWEILWNDPMNVTEFKDLAEFMKVKTESIHGFLSNTKRGTAFYYTEAAVDNFLYMNGLQFVLRAHEVVPLGYKFHLNGKVATVFSSSRYCGGTNLAASIFCDNEELRVIRFETFETL